MTNHLWGACSDLSRLCLRPGWGSESRLGVDKQSQTTSEFAVVQRRPVDSSCRFLVTPPFAFLAPELLVFDNPKRSKTSYALILFLDCSCFASCDNNIPKCHVLPFLTLNPTTHFDLLTCPKEQRPFVFLLSEFLSMLPKGRTSRSNLC